MHRASCILNRESGVSLTELIIVVTIIGILAVALGYSFQGWMGAYRIESQTKEMYVDLMNARARAMQRNRSHFVVVTANNYQVVEDANENNINDDAALPEWTTPKPLQYAVTAGAGTYTIITRGLVSPEGTIRFNAGTNTPDYDCIFLRDTRMNIGLWNGTACAAK